jgi:hypothetical protein
MSVHEKKNSGYLLDVRERPSLRDIISLEFTKQYGSKEFSIQI